MKIFSPFKTKITSPEMLREVAKRQIKNFRGIEFRKTWSLPQDVFNNSIEHSSLPDALHIYGNGLRIKYKGEGSQKAKLTLVNVDFVAPNATFKKVKAINSKAELKASKEYLRTEKSTVKIGDIGAELDVEDSHIKAGNIGMHITAFRSNLETGDITNNVSIRESNAKIGNVGNYLCAIDSTAEAKNVSNGLRAVNSEVTASRLTGALDVQLSRVSAFYRLLNH